MTDHLTYDEGVIAALENEPYDEYATIEWQIGYSDTITTTASYGEQAKQELVPQDLVTLVNGQLNELDKLIQRYHGRDGTKNFHYAGYSLHDWHSTDDELRDRMETADYAVYIIYTDNSMSYDAYWVTLNEVLEWNQNHGGV